MIVVSKPLITKRFTGEEFKNKSVLNEGVTIEDIQRRVEKNWRKMLREEDNIQFMGIGKNTKLFKWYSQTNLLRRNFHLWKRLSKAREIYLCGIEWNYEFLFQRMYMALLIIGCMFLKNFSIRTNIIYILLHVVSLYFFGYKKSMWECSLREKYTKLYISYQI